MNKIDFSDFARRLNDIADTYGAKHLSEGALKAWFVTLESETARDCGDALAQWLRSGTRMPTPADIYRIANERGINRREQDAAADKADEAKIVQRFAATDKGREALRQIKELLAKKLMTRPDPREWAHRILDRFADGEDMPDISVRYACEALGMDEAKVRKTRREAA